MDVMEDVEPKNEDCSRMDVMDDVEPKNEDCSRMDVMDDVELLDDVVASIQVRLPLVRLARSRTVCRSWNKAVDSPWFLRERLEARGGARERVLCLLGSLDGDGAACCIYDLVTDRWYPLELDQPWVRDTTVKFPTGTGGGGVLLSAEYAQPSGQTAVIPYMGNPVARSWTSLPTLLGGLHIWHVLGVFVDTTARCFKVVALHETRLWWHDLDRDIVNTPTFIFDSSVGSWRVINSVLPTREVFDISSGQGVFVGNVLYCVAAAHYLGQDHCNLLAYDMERSRWSWLALANPPYLEYFHISYCKLISVQERLLCVAQRTWWFENVGKSWSIVILELDFTSMTWTEVDMSIPDSMCAHFVHRTGVGLSMYNIKVAAGGHDFEVYIIHSTLDLIDIAAVDLRQTPAVWRWLPPCPYQDSVVKSFHCLDPWLEFGSWNVNRRA